MRDYDSLFPKHKYGRWKDTHKFISETQGIIRIVQQRVCEKCGRVQLRTRQTE